MLKLINIFILVSSLFVISCTNDENYLSIGKKIEFTNDKIEVNQNSFSEKSQLDQQISNKSWTQKGGDEFHSLTNVFFKFPMKKKWSFNSNQEISDELPLLTDLIAYDGRLYILNAYGLLYCLDINDGSLIWKLRALNSSKNLILGSGSAVISKNLNSIFLHNGTNEIISINLKTHKTNWIKKLKMPLRGSMAIKNNNLFVNDFEGNLINLSLENGNILWKNKLNSSNVSIYTNSRPIVIQNNIINPGSNGTFHVLNIKSGNLVFSDVLTSSNREIKFFDNNDIIANPIFKSPYLYVISHSGNMSAYNIHSFKNIWNVPIGSKNTPVVSGKTIFNIDNKGILYALNVESGLVRWKTKFKSEIIKGYFFEEKKFINFKGPYLIGNKLVLLDDNRTLFLINPDTGKVIKKVNFNSNINSGIFLTNQIIFLYSNGMVTSFN